MKRLIVLSLIAAGMVLTAGFSIPTQAQSPANDFKPTYISPTPGLYVNGWPAFTVSYPKEWVEVPIVEPFSVFNVGSAGPDLPPGSFLEIIVVPNPLPLEEWAKWCMPVWVQNATDIKILSDKPSQLKDGTPAREVETEYLYKVDPTGRSVKNGPKKNGFLLVTKKDVTWVGILLGGDEGTLREDVKRIAYSLTFQPDREKPVQVPPDVRAFLDMYCADAVSHDVKAIMAHYSDRFLYSGAGKAYTERLFWDDPTCPIRRGVISYEATVTVFEPHGDKAYMDGFFLSKEKGDASALKSPMSFQQIINEHGQWKWFGNQK